MTKELEVSLDYVKVCGDLGRAELLAWVARLSESEGKDNSGFFHRSYEDMTAELGLRAETLRKMLGKLSRAGVISTRRVGFPGQFELRFNKVVVDHYLGNRMVSQ